MTIQNFFEIFHGYECVILAHGVCVFLDDNDFETFERFTALLGTYTQEISGQTVRRLFNNAIEGRFRIWLEVDMDNSQ
jgi:hypothetical protein